MDPRSFENIDEFLGEPGGRKTNRMEQELDELLERDLEHLNEYLTMINLDRDPTRDWTNQLANGNADVMFSEAELVYHLRRTFGDAVEMNAPIHDESEAKDFDACVDLGDWRVWIEVTYDRIVDEIEQIGGGWMSPEKTGKKLDNKIQSDFKEAREVLDENDVLVLAMYMEATQLQQLLMGRRLELGGYYDETEYVDGFIQFWNIDGTSMGYEGWTEKGEAIQAEMERMYPD